MPHIVPLCSLRIVQNTFRVYSQDGFGPVDVSSRALWGQSPVLPNKNQQRVRLCRKQASQSSHRVEGYFEIAADQRERAVSCFAYLGVLPIVGM